MITNKQKKVKQNHQGSSLLLPAHGKGGVRTTINNNSPSPSEKFLAKPKSRRAKRKGGLGEMNFCPPVVPQSGTEGGKRFRNSALAEYQNRKIFVSLIEKIFCVGAIKKIFRKFFCFVRRSEAEAGGNAGRDYSKSASGFCSKKVRISSKRHRQLSLFGFWQEFWTRYASPLRGSALYFKRIFQGFLKSRISFCSAIWKFDIAKQRNPAERDKPIFFLSPEAKSKVIISVPLCGTAQKRYLKINVNNYG